MDGPTFRDRWQRFLLFYVVICLLAGSLAFYLGATLDTHEKLQLSLAVGFWPVAAVVVLLRASRRNASAEELKRRVPGVRPLWLVYSPVLHEGSDLARRQAAAYEERMPGTLGLTAQEIVFLPLKQPLFRPGAGFGLLGSVVATLAAVRQHLLARPTLQRWNRSALEAVLAMPPADLRMTLAGLERLRLQFKKGPGVDFACVGARRLQKLLRRELAACP